MSAFDPDGEIRVSSVKRLAAVPLKAFARNLVRLRDRAGMTQEAVAEGTGISPRYYQTLEAGGKCPSLAVVIALREVLGCTYDELLVSLNAKIPDRK